MNRIAAVIAGLSLAFVGTSTTFAATINVPGDYGLIQTAIDASVNGDVIAIAPGTYYENWLNPGGKAITIQGTLNSNGSLATSINGENIGSSVFVIQSEEDNDTVIKDLIITGGSADFGGGIYCVDSDPTIIGCTITNNTSLYGGGGVWCGGVGNLAITDCRILNNTTGRDEPLIYGSGGGINCSGGNPVITGCTISSNTASFSGGGIYCYTNSYATINDCTIEDNSAGGQDIPGYGGGVHCAAESDFEITATITDCMIRSNSATKRGGGIYSIGAISTINDCTISNNTSHDGGGGLYVRDSDSNIIDCRLLGNSSLDGGGLYLWESNSSIQDCEILGNGAKAGGGIFCYISNAVMTNCTISDNVASDPNLLSHGGGIACYTYSDAIISNCIITNNTAGRMGGGIFCNSSDPTIANCVISGNTVYEGGGIACLGSDPDIIDCQIMDNLANKGGGINCASSSIPNISGSIISDNSATSGGGIHHSEDGGISILMETIVCGNAVGQIEGNWGDYGGNNIADECPGCPGDATGDLFVDVDDLLYVLSVWNSDDANADFDDDGLVDADDVLILLSHYGESCP